MSEFKPGDHVRVKDEFDIPAVFRGGRPTTGVVSDDTRTAYVLINVPIGDVDPAVHSQCVPYEPHMLEHTNTEENNV